MSAGIDSEDIDEADKEEDADEDDKELNEEFILSISNHLLSCSGRVDRYVSAMFRIFNIL